MDKYCRVCARSSDFPSFDLTMESQITKVRIDDMLVYCTQQEIANEDCFPQQICAECFATLNSAFLFRKLTYESAASFQEMANNVLIMPSLESKVVLEETPFELPPLSTTEDAHIKEEPQDAIEEQLETYCYDAYQMTEANNDEAELPTEIEIRTKVKRRRSRKLLRKEVRLRYVCHECYYSTYNKFNFQRHQNSTKHSKFTEILNLAPDGTTQVSDDVLPASFSLRMQCERCPTKKTLYRCKDCKFHTFTKFTIARHQSKKKHSGVFEFSEPFPEQDLARLHKCQACGEVFTSSLGLTSHKKKSTDNYRSSLDAKAKQRAKRIMKRGMREAKIKEEIEADQ